MLTWKSFNAGVHGMAVPEDAWMLEQILASRPARLRWVFLEIDFFQTAIKDGEKGTLRSVAWHDWPRFWSLCRRLTAMTGHLSLLDIYTIQRALTFDHPKDSSKWTWFDELRQTEPGLRRGIGGKKIGFCGDVRRGRTVRSLSRLLTLFDDMSMYFVSPPHPKLRIAPEMKSLLSDRKAEVREFSSFDDPCSSSSVIENLDVLYMTRLQREHNSPEDEADFANLDFNPYRLTPKLVSRMKPYAAILHPFPRDEEFGEIPTSIDADPRAYYFRQARNGMWVRAALLAYLFDVDSQIADYYEKYTAETKDYNTGVL